jgi:hypothetical protein
MRLGLAIASLQGSVETAEDVEDVDDVVVIGGERPFVGRQGVLEERLGFAVPALVPVQEGQIGTVLCRLGMVLAELPHANGQRPLLQRLDLVDPPFHEPTVEAAEDIEGKHLVIEIPPRCSLVDGQRLLEQGLRLGIAGQAPVAQGQIVPAFRRVAMLLAELLDPNAERELEQRHAVGRALLLEVDPAHEVERPGVLRLAFPQSRRHLEGLLGQWCGFLQLVCLEGFVHSSIEVGQLGRLRIPGSGRQCHECEGKNDAREAERESSRTHRYPQRTTQYR